MKLLRLASAAIWRPEATASPHLRRTSSWTSLKLALATVTRDWRSFLSAAFTSVMARHVAVFLPTTAPRRALDLTMQYGIPRALHRLGSQQTTSIGSTSCAMTTSWAFFSSTRDVTWLMPILTATGRLAAALPPAATVSAWVLRRSFFSVRVSGLSLLRRRNSWDAWRLSKVLENWLIAGGILMRLRSVILERWMRTYLGHLTKRVRSRFPGRTSPPMLYVRGFFSTALRGNSTLGADPLVTFFTIVKDAWLAPC